MRILHYQHSSGLGGVTDLTLDLIKYSSKDFQYTFVCNQGDLRTENEFNNLGITYLTVPFKDSTVEQAIKRSKPDVVHCQPGAHAECAGVNAAIRLSIPIVITVGTSGTANQKYIEHPLVTIVAGSENLFSKQSEKAILIQHGVDLDRLQCGDKRQAKGRWGLDPDRPVVGWMGRYIAFKCPGTTIGIAKRVQDIRSDIQFVMFGDKDGYEPAVELAEEIGANIVFAGGTREKGLAYGAMDIGLFPTFGEAFGRVAAEMLGAGVSMICSQCPTNTEIAGPYAIYLPTPNYWNDNHEAEYYCQTWAYAILALLESEKPHLDMARAGEQRARDLFDARVMAEKYNDLYRKVA